MALKSPRCSCTQCPGRKAPREWEAQHATPGMMSGHHWLQGQSWSSKKCAFQVAEVDVTAQWAVSCRVSTLRCAVYLGSRLSKGGSNWAS